MKKSTFTLAAALTLAGLSLGVTACTQAPAPVAAAPDTPAPAAAPAPVVMEDRRPVIVEDRRPVVVEEHNRRPGIDINVHKRGDGDHTSVDIHARP